MLCKVESHDVKFFCTMSTRNWNRSFCPFLGYYCQRGDSFNLNYQCEIMTDEEHIAHHNNTADEWEYELSVNAD